MSANPGRKMRRRYLHSQHQLGKSRGVWGWRVAHGARRTRSTTAGGRAASAGAFVQRHVRPGGRAVRRKYVARRIKAAS